MSLAEEIKKAREKAGLSQRQVGAMFGLGSGTRSQVAMSEWEAGRRPINIDEQHIGKLATLLRVTESEAQTALREYRRAYKAKLRARRARRNRALETAPAPATAAAPEVGGPLMPKLKALQAKRDAQQMPFLEALIETYPKPASLDTSALLEWYKAITLLHTTLAKAAAK